MKKLISRLWYGEVNFYILSSPIALLVCYLIYGLFNKNIELSIFSLLIPLFLTWDNPIISIATSLLFPLLLRNKNNVHNNSYAELFRGIVLTVGFLTTLSTICGGLTIGAGWLADQHPSSSKWDGTFLFLPLLISIITIPLSLILTIAITSLFSLSSKGEKQNDNR